MLHGACDATCAASVAKEALEAMSSKDKTWVLVSDAKHDLELDNWRDEWFAHSLEWMQRQVSKSKQLSTTKEEAAQ
jgi:alpha-beta hydrolase superfamily lysophospholipase